MFTAMPHAAARNGAGSLWRSKLRATLAHLGLSTAVVGIVCSLIFLVWYPRPYFQAQGAWNVLQILIGVDLVVGPLLTLIVFKPAKPRLLLDLTVIVVIQLTALAYGTTVIYRERPYFTVFAVDRFHVLAKEDVDLGQIDPSLLESKPSIGPLLVVATLPEDAARLQRLLEEVVFEGKEDIEQRPEFWHRYAEQAQNVIDRAQPLDALRDARPHAAGAIDRMVAALPQREARLGFVPLVAKHRDFAFVVDLDTGQPIELIDADPWTAVAR